MEKWLGETLSKCLDCVVTKEMMATILAIKNDEEFDNYFGNLLCEDVEEHRLFLHNCRHMLLSGKQPRSNNKKKSPPTFNSPPVQKASSGAAKKQNKHVNLYSGDGKIVGNSVLLKGRRSCDCQVTEHQLINNCLGCGRIVCEQEGSGPCLYCGEPVYTAEEEQQMAKAAASNRASTKGQTKAQRKQQQQQQQKASAKSNKELQQALEQRDRLLEYDRNSEKRTTVIDDELDYFQENSVWLTDAEREKFEQLKSEMHEMKHGSRLKRKIKVDFAGRNLPEEPPVTTEYEQLVLRQLAAASKAASQGQSHGLTGHSSLGLAPNLDVTKPPVFKASKELQNMPAPIVGDGLERIYNRVQDKELLEMQDMRQCLSMHQPWASLLVAGIKKHEGRVWYSEHRGRLWIASTAKEPHAEDIAQLEQFYRELYKDENIKFPTHYPTSSLLGCVNVESCLPQEEYRELYPEGESDSPYVFVCSRPEQLPVLLPVQGEPKIYELPLKTHNAACKTLLRARANKG
ncbi:PREDICTED: activating signal cointegrator 1 [Drosophila arizonae]|uniref:Activating signal cointegrator 1 n=1 Tax=Drosophila arizonae TaxID=7263 RepID=A0ABM1PYG0_DROAR|nr:PREDICTED: activating signal cointegrator 1 [Drosophila arizonae]